MNKYQRLIFCLFLWLSFSSAIAQSFKEKLDTLFEYSDKKLPVGNVYHYTKSNIDGSRPIRVSYFIKTACNIEIYKYETGYKDAAHIKASMNWETYVPDEINSFVFTNDSIWQTAQTQWKDNWVSVDVHVLDHLKDTVYPDIFPAHMYNFDFASLNFSFPFLKKPEKGFTFGVVDPTYKPNSADIFFYRGDAEISYEGETEDGKNLLYSLTGRGMNFTEGSIWVSKKNGVISNMEIPIPDNPGWTSFKLELIKIEKMTPDEWKKYIYSNF